MGAEKPAVLGGTAIRPEEKKGMAGVMEFVHNKRDGTFFGRTCKSWAQITLFYLVYYTILFAIWYGFFRIFMLTLDEDQPKWQREAGLISKHPGLGVRPSQPLDEIGDSVLMLDKKFDGQMVKHNKTYLDSLEGSAGYALRLNRFFETYENNTNNPDAVDCTGGPTDDKTKFCRFDRTTLSECETFPYGYAGDNFAPCVFIKLNRIFGLKPEPIESKDNFTDTMHPEMTKAIEDAGFPEDKIYVDCRGEYPADIEAVNPIQHYPADKSIPLKYFPMTTKKANENAMVAVQFKNLPVGQLVHVICKAYYKGVIHSKKFKQGMVTFQLYVKPPKAEKED